MHDAAVRAATIMIALLLAGCGGSSGAPPPGAADGSGTQGARGTARSAPRAAAPFAVATRRIGTLPQPVQLPAVAALPDDHVLSMGGLDASDASSDAIVEVSPSGRSQLVGRLPTALHDAGGAAIGNTAYLLGGGNAGTGSPDIVSVRRGRTAATGRLPMGASDVATATIGRSVFVVGGFTGSRSLRSILRFTPGRAVQISGRMPRPLRYAAVAAYRGRVVIAGGTSGTRAVRDILSFDPATGRVRRVGELPRALTHASAAVLGGRLLIIGGRGDGPSSQRRTILAVDPATGRVRRVGELPVGLSDTAAISDAGRIVLLGGRDTAGAVRREILTIAARRASPIGSTAPARIAPLLAPRNVYAAANRRGLDRALRTVRPRVYVPDSRDNSVDVIDQQTGRRVRHFATGGEPQHIVPSWDLRTLYVTADDGNSLTPIDARSGKPGPPIRVRDPYNLYFTADGRRAIVVAERYRRLDFREPHTFRLRKSLPVPTCRGVDHMDFTRGGRMALVSCEFSGRLIVVDLRRERLVKTIALSPGSMPQDVRLAPDGRTFYVADMARGGVWTIAARGFRRDRFIGTGAGTHGLYPSRDARVLYVSNRGAGTVSRISFRTRRVLGHWAIPGGASPDMGGVSVDGRRLWLTGRYDSELYAIDTRTGRLVRRISVGNGPHGAVVWPQPGRYSIGHTGIMR